jgi:hypothetical protein
MPRYLNDSLVTVYPFTHSVEQDAVVIGDIERDRRAARTTPGTPSEARIALEHES